MDGIHTAKLAKNLWRKLWSFISYDAIWDSKSCKILPKCLHRRFCLYAIHYEYFCSFRISVCNYQHHLGKCMGLKNLHVLSRTLSPPYSMGLVVPSAIRVCFTHKPYNYVHIVLYRYPVLATKNTIELCISIYRFPYETHEAPLRICIEILLEWLSTQYSHIITLFSRYSSSFLDQNGVNSLFLDVLGNPYLMKFVTYLVTASFLVCTLSAFKSTAMESFTKFSWQHFSCSTSSTCTFSVSFKYLIV